MYYVVVNAGFNDVADYTNWPVAVQYILMTAIYVLICVLDIASLRVITFVMFYQIHIIFDITDIIMKGCLQGILYRSYNKQLCKALAILNTEITENLIPGY